MKTSMQRRKDEQQNLFGTTAVVLPEGNACHIVSVGKRRDGGTRYLPGAAEKCAILAGRRAAVGWLRHGWRQSRRQEVNLGSGRVVL
jgi:hypothetical protein